MSEEATVPRDEAAVAKPAPVDRAQFFHAWTGGQWSFVRAVIGVFTIAQIVDSTIARETTNAATIVIAGLGVVAAIALVIGAWSRAAAVALIALQWKATPEWLIVNGVRDLPLLVFVFAQPAPFGSFAARGRIDPNGGWRPPRFLLEVLWICTWLIALALAMRLLVVFERATAGENVLAFTGAIYVALTFFRGTGPFGWACFFVGSTLAFASSRLGDDRVDLPMSLVVLSTLPLLFDPMWLPPRHAAAPELVFFDGHCGLCHRLVRFVLAEDPERLFVFSTLQGEKIKTVLDEAARARLPDSVVVQDSQGRVLVKSAAVVHVYDRLGGIWRVVALVLRVIPTALRDFGYDFVARIRHKIFARPADSCPLMPPNLKDRFVA